MKAAPSVAYAPRTRDWRPPRTMTSLVARMRGSRLDRELARGVAPWRSPTHAARSLQLTGPRSRVFLARSLESLIARAELSRRDLIGSAVVPPSREQVYGALAQILAVAGRLRDSSPVRARGAAALRILLSDGAGPCYRRGQRDELARALDEVARWLDTEE
jgi:hypothetical protein